jgi:hypothetical protein
MFATQAHVPGQDVPGEHCALFSGSRDRRGYQCEVAQLHNDTSTYVYACTPVDYAHAYTSLCIDTLHIREHIHVSPYMPLHTRTHVRIHVCAHTSTIRYSPGRPRRSQDPVNANGDSAYYAVPSNADSPATYSQHTLVWAPYASVPTL